jgi:hypothetical protein
MKKAMSWNFKKGPATLFGSSMKGGKGMVKKKYW